MFLGQKTIQYLLIPWMENYATVFDKKNSTQILVAIDKFLDKPSPNFKPSLSRQINNCLSVYLVFQFELQLGKPKIFNNQGMKAKVRAFKGYYLVPPNNNTKTAKLCMKLSSTPYKSAQQVLQSRHFAHKPSWKTLPRKS